MTDTLEAGPRFDAVAMGWDAKPGRLEMTRAIADAIAGAVPLHPEMRVLDFGTGTGQLALTLAPHVATVTALDASCNMLRVLAENLRAAGIDNVTPLHAKIETVFLPTTHFDLVVGAMVLHHIAHVPLTLRRLRAAMRPGGWIALADLDAEDGTFHTDRTGVHHYGFDHAHLRQWLEEAGFLWHSVRTAHRLTRVGHDGATRTYPLFLAAAQRA